jgi:GNAT superfamily N-acetyltransferase
MKSNSVLVTYVAESLNITCNVEDEEDSKYVGMVLLDHDGVSEFMTLYALWVDPEYRGTSVSDVLIQKAITAATERGMKRIECTINAKIERVGRRAERRVAQADANKKVRSRFVRWGFVPSAPEHDSDSMQLVL